MPRFATCIAVVVASLICLPLLGAAEPDKAASGKVTGVAAADWPWWRGPQRNGIADANQKPPVEFSDTQNVRWKAPLVGRGHGSATVVGKKVFIATADEKEQTQSVACFDRDTGKQLWLTEVHKGNFIKGGNNKSSHASSTPACDGERVFINFVNNNAVYTTALSINGKQLWQTKIADYVIHQGFGSSPAVYGPLLVIMADSKAGGAIAGVDRVSGEIVWKQERPKLPNYSSPSILNIGGRDQVLMIGCDLVTSFDPLSGKKIWETAGSTTECVTTAVTDGKRIFTSGGYPKNHISAMLADGSGKIDWENNVRVYVPSMLVRDERLYCLTDAGVAMCRDSTTGKELYNLRLGGTFSASPVIVGDIVHAVNESGVSFAFKITPDAFENLVENKVGDEAFATHSICGGQIFLRTATQVDGKRQESLYCFEQK